MIQFLDEVEFTSFIYEIMLASGPAFAKAAMNAARNRAVHGRIFISTPGDLSDKATQEALKIIESTARWSEKFYDMSRSEMKDYLNANTGNNDNPIVYVEYHYYQLGEGREWFNKMCGILMNDKIAIRRELLLQRVDGSNNSPFDLEDLMAITDSKRKPIREEIIFNKYSFDIYEEVKKNEIVIMAIDTATGAGGDNNAITIINPYTLKPVAEFACRYISSVDMRKLVYYITKKMYPNAIIVPERNFGGYAIIDELLETDIGHRIYYEDVSNLESLVDTRLDGDGFAKRDAAQRKVRGVTTSPKTRPLMMKILITHVEEHKDKFITNNIITDLNNLVTGAGGKIEAAKGKHDDSIMSYLIGLYVIYYGKNLKRFGFFKGLTSEELEAQNSGLIHEESPLDLMEQIAQQSDMVDENFVKGFKTGIKSDEDSYDEYQKVIENARRKAMSFNDPYVNSNVTMYNDEMDMHSDRGVVDIGLFDELNS